MSRYYETRENSSGQWPGTHRALTKAGEEWTRQHGYMPADDGDARADSVTPVLEEIVTTDFSGRRVYEFVGDKSVWMDVFKGPVYEQTAMTNDAERTRRQGQAYLQANPNAVKVVL